MGVSNWRRKSQNGVQSRKLFGRG